LFGNFIHSGDLRLIALGFFVGAGAMTIGGLAELVLGVRAEGKSLENIATPLIAEETEAGPRQQASVRASRELVGATPEDHQETRERKVRVARRAGDRAAHERHGVRAVRPGPGSAFYSPGQIGTAGTTSRWEAASNEAMDREIIATERAVDEMGPSRRRALAHDANARLWGPSASVVHCGRPGRVGASSGSPATASARAGGTEAAPDGWAPGADSRPQPSRPASLTNTPPR
jgi:hypothetical protein